MVSQADRELINNFVIELRPYLETVEVGVREFAQPNRDGVIVGQAVQALMMIRGAGQILMVDGLVSISSWLVESFEKIQNNPDIAPADASRRLNGLYSAMEDYLVALDRADESVDGIVMRAKTIFEAIPAFGGPLPGTGKLRQRTDLDALFGEDDHAAVTKRISDDAADTEQLAARQASRDADQTAEMPSALPTVPLQRQEQVTQPVHEKVTQPSREAPARIVPIPPQPTEELPKVDPELREIFEEEALEIIAAFGDGIRELARNPSNRDAIRNLNRAAHTLKGAANMTGFPLIAQIGAAIELLFDEQIERGQPVGRDVLELVAVSWKMLRAMIPNLNDLSSFTSPSNSIVQRAAVLREQLAQAHADAETIPMDEQHYGARERDDRATASTDEIVDVGVQVPEPPQHQPEVDAMLVEAAPTVPLRRDPVPSTPAEPEPVIEEPVQEIDVVVPEPTVDEPVVEATADSASAATDEISTPVFFGADAPAEAETDTVIEESPEPAEPAPFWGESETSEPAGEVVELEDTLEAVAETPFWGVPDDIQPFDADAPELEVADEKPQSEPFWTPGTEELMRSSVGTDMLIADIQGLDDLDDDIAEDSGAEASDGFFTSVDADVEVEIESAPADDGSWLEETEHPQTDLLNFDSTPQTEPFWNSIESLLPETAPEEAPEQDEVVTMDPFFEPVNPDTSFLHQPASPAAEQAEGEIEEPFVAPTVEEDMVIEDVESFELLEDADIEPADAALEYEPVAFDHEFVAEAEPLETVLPDALIELPEPVEAPVVDEFDPAASAESDYSYTYAFDFEEVEESAAFETAAEDVLVEEAEAVEPEAPAVGTEEFWTPEHVEAVAEDIDDEVVAEEPAAGTEEFYTPEYIEPVVDAVIETAPDELPDAEEDVVALEVGTEEFWTPEYIEPVVEAAVEETEVEAPSIEEAPAPAFESDLAGLLATAALTPDPYLPEPFAIAFETAAVEEIEVVEVVEVDPAYWEELDALVPSYMHDAASGSIIAEFDAIPDDAEAFEAYLAALEELATEVSMVEFAGEDLDSTEEAGVETDESFEVEADEFEEDVVIETEEVTEAEPEDAVVSEDVYAEPAEAETGELVLDEMDLTPFEAEDAEDVLVEPAEAPQDEDIVLDDAGEYATAAEADEIQEEPAFGTGSDALAEFDDVVASFEDETGFGDLDWFEEPEQVVEETVEAEEVLEAFDEVDEVVEPVDVDDEFGEIPPGTGTLADSGTGRLNRPTTDTLGFGSIDLDSFLTTEGSIALSSALLDMAFSTPADVLEDDGLGTQSISVFDESSERALEIEMFETFALEAEDHIATINRAAMQLDRDPLATEPLIDIKRALHTIKGAAAAADFMEISDLAHQLEDSLATHERLGTLHDRTFTTELFSSMEAVESKLSRRKDELFGITEEEQSGGTLRIDVGRVDDLLNTVGELVVNRSSLEERLERLETTIEDLATAAARLQRSSYLLEREASSEDAIGRLLRGEITSRDAGLAISDVQSEWDMLEMDRYTEFDRLIRQLAEVGADVSTAVGEINSLHGDFDTISNRQRRLTTVLQDELMGIRMVPISSLAPRLYRVVRRAATRRGKEVSLIIEGGETPFDKLLLDTLAESLLHLLRNSVDHGIEEINERRRLGKPDNGSIRIRAFRDGSEAVIEIIDDGAGIDHEAVIRHAHERGLDVPENITREEALLLIFEPGFTTKDEADDISGRGLGLEIVEQTVSRYKGRVAVDSVIGRGTVFSLRLPVMLSVIQAFLVSAGEGEFAIPVANIDYVVDRVDQPLTQIGDSVVVETANQIIPVVDVGARIGRSKTPVIEKTSGWVMVTEIAGKRWALVVDELRGQQEIVVKPMGRFLRATPGLMGATILGHGDVALIVDVPALLGVDSLVTRLNKVPLGEGAALADAPPAQDVANVTEKPSQVVLVVDDSLSVRRVVSRTIERHGWVAMLARDGVEALELLEQGHASIVLTDIEMPRMDGFELISSIRSRSSFEDLPIVVLTSRSGEKHRERALGLGANEYLVKPFQEQELLDVIEQMSRTSSSV